MASKHFHILLIENNPSEVGRLKEMLAAVPGRFTADVVVRDSLDGGISFLHQTRADLIIYNPERASALRHEGYLRLREQAPDCAVIIADDREDEVLQSLLLSGGVQDYLVKSRIDINLLAHSVLSSIERQRRLTDLQAKARDFQSSEGRFLNVIVNNIDGIIVIDTHGIVKFVNPAAEQLMGRDRNSLLGTELPFQIKPAERREYIFTAENGRYCAIDMSAVQTTWDGERALLISLHDISMRVAAEKGLRDSEERYALALKGARDGLWDWDLVSNRIYFSPLWKEMLGYGESDIDGTPEDWYQRIHPEDSPDVHKAIGRHLDGETPTFEQEFRIRHRDGSWRWVFCRGSIVRDRFGKPIRLAGSQSDFTARKNAERELKQALVDLQFALASEKVLMEELDRKNRELVELSTTDGLTGLFNHRFLQQRFDFEFKRTRRYGGNLACMMIDIDHFKMLNDTYGHQFGDLVLRELAGLIKANSRDVDICGRYGGEEFMVVSNLQMDGALKHASKLHAAIDSHLFSFEDKVVHVTVSIGIAELRSDISSKQELIERADSALYEAKEAGRNVIRQWKERETEDQNTVDRFSVSELKTKFTDLSSQMRAAYMESTNALVRAVEAKDPYEHQHSERVADYSVKLARKLNLSEGEIEVIKYAALLHDVGKIGVKQEILVKTEPLTPAEFDVLKKHPIVGVNILKEVKFLEKEIPIVMHHHERFDGKGYPHGLRGREIPLGARIVALADTFEAMTAGRTYRQPKTIETVISVLQQGKNEQFDPDLTDTFIGILEEEMRLGEKDEKAEPVISNGEGGDTT